MRSEIAKIIRQDQVMELVYGNSNNPKQLLGRHIVENGQVISCYHPDAVAMCLIDEDGKRYEMEHVERVPVYALFVPTKKKFVYEIEMTFRDGNTYVAADPYCFSNQISAEEEQKFLSGRWKNCYEKLGAHPMAIHGTKGVHFAVWAPNARRVSVIGDFNYWNGMIHPMQRHEDSGIFELFIPKVDEKALYKFEIKTWDGEILQRIDTFGSIDIDGDTNTSMVLNMKEYAWKDQQWMKDRRRKKWNEIPFAVCDEELLHDPLVDFNRKNVAFTHVLLEAPGFSHGLKGNIREWIDDLHKKDIGVILKVCLGTFSDEEDGLKFYDGRSVYGYADERLSFDEKNKVYRFDHSKEEVRSYLISYLIFWMREYHVDGFFLKGVSEMIHPSYEVFNADGQKEMRTLYQQAAEEFIIRAVNEVKKEDYSVLVLSDEKQEASTQNEDLVYSKASFDALINYSIPENYLEYLSTGTLTPERKYYRLSLPLMKTGLSNSVLDIALRPKQHAKLLSFDTSHLNEQEHASWGRLSMGYLMGIPGKKRWSGNRVESLMLNQYLHELFQVYRNHSCMYTQEPDKNSLVWMNGMDAQHAILSFVRRSSGRDKKLLFICNFSRERQEGYPIGVPKFGDYQMIINSEWQDFGGFVKRDEVKMHSLSKEWDLQPYSLRVTIPALSVLIFEF